MLKIADQKTDKNIPSQDIVPQRQIEVELAQIVNLGNLECVYLFSADGLLISGVQGRSDFTQDNALEVAYSVYDGFEFLRDTDGFAGGMEVLLFDRSRRKIGVRIFKAFDQDVMMVLVIPPGRRYRFLTNRLIGLIKQISKQSLKY